MKDEALLELLEQAAEKLEIKVGYDDLRKGEVSTPGGLFMLRGEKRILIHKSLSAGDKADLLIELLAGVETEDLHLPPNVRERIENARAKTVKAKN